MPARSAGRPATVAPPPAPHGRLASLGVGGAAHLLPDLVAIRLRKSRNRQESASQVAISSVDASLALAPKSSSASRSAAVPGAVARAMPAIIGDRTSLVGRIVAVGAR